MDHLFSRDLVGNLMLVALRSLQLESGSGLHLLENPGEWVPYLTPCWLTSVRHSLNSHKIKIKVASAKRVPLSQDNDHHMMDKVCKLGVYNDSQLFDINAVCMYLQVMTLLDIANAKGKRISDEAFKGTKLRDRYFVQKWPRQPVITMKQKNLWKAVLEAAFTSSGMVLKQSLGTWMNTPTQVWRNFFNPATQNVVTSTTDQETQFFEYKMIWQTRHGVTATPVEVAPVHAKLEEVDWNVMIPAMVLKTRTRNVIAEFNLHTTTIQANEKPKTTFDEYVETLPVHIQ
jgi:hypothetical protein